MQKFVMGSLLLILFGTMSSKVFASSFNCKFKEEVVQGVETIQIANESLIINKELEIPLEKSRVKCGNFGRQTRFDGRALGYQIVLKTCSTQAELEGHLIDSVHETVANVYCRPVGVEQ